MAKKPVMSAGQICALLIFCVSACVERGFCQSQGEGDKHPNSELVNQVIFLYESGRLDEAEHLALKILDAPGALNRMEQSDIYLVLAFCSIANDDEENGRRHFISALKNNPNLKPDPIGWSPKVRQVFNRARDEWIQIAQAAVQRELSIEAELCRQAAYHSLLLPGSGQIDKGHTISGWIQGALFWGGLATAIYAQASLPALSEKYRDAIYPDKIENAYNEYRAMSRIAIVSSSVTLSIYGYSAIDALWRRPEAALLAPKTP